MDKKQKRALKRKKKIKHLKMLSQHDAIRQKAEDAFNLVNYKIHLHSNPEQHAQMAEEGSKSS